MKLSNRLPRESGRDYALRTIKENIVSLELAPGSQISENALAAEMGLSRTPVRDRPSLNCPRWRSLRSTPSVKARSPLLTMTW